MYSVQEGPANQYAPLDARRREMDAPANPDPLDAKLTELFIYYRRSSSSQYPRFRTASIVMRAYGARGQATAGGGR